MGIGADVAGPIVGIIAPVSEPEYALDERVGEGQVGAEDGGVGFAQVPDGPFAAEGEPEGIVLVEDGSDDLIWVRDNRDDELILLTVKVPIKNIPHKTALFFFGSFTLKRRGIGMEMIIKSEEILRTAFVIKWFVAAEHWRDDVGTAQYWLNGRHHTPR